MKSTLIRDGYTLTIEQEAIPYRERGHHELDPKWSYTDENGHVHTSTDSLEWVVTGTYWCDTCCDEHDEGEWRCRECAAVVEPQYVWKDTSQETRYIAGLTDSKLEFDDGRGYLLRGDDLHATIDAEGNLAAEFLERIREREPDWWTAFTFQSR
jgi:hypothetical protein